jgi:hypothetical protein
MLSGLSLIRSRLVSSAASLFGRSIGTAIRLRDFSASGLVSLVKVRSGGDGGPVRRRRLAGITAGSTIRFLFLKVGKGLSNTQCNVGTVSIEEKKAATLQNRQES